MRKDEYVRMSLANEGILLEEQTVLKNGIEKKALRVSGKKISPLFYLSDIEKMEISQARQWIKKNIETAAMQLPEDLMSWDANEKRIRFGLQNAKTKNSAIIVPLQEINPVFDNTVDMQAYLYCSIGNEGSFAVTEDVLKAWGVDRQDAIRAALYNTKKDAQAVNMTDIIPVFTGDGPKMVVLTSTSGYRGAAALLSQETIDRVMSVNEWQKVKVIPSSVHECILVDGSVIEVDDLNDMIRNVNADEVAPEDRLSDHAYMYDGKTVTSLL